MVPSIPLYHQFPGIFLLLFLCFPDNCDDGDDDDDDDNNNADSNADEYDDDDDNDDDDDDDNNDDDFNDGDDDDDLPQGYRRGCLSAGDRPAVVVDAEEYSLPGLPGATHHIQTNLQVGL